MERFEFSTICRLCIGRLESKNVSPIFDNEMYVGKITLPERIKCCSSIKVAEGDGLPSHICTNCLLKLNESFVFRNQCILADIALRRLVNDLTIEMTELKNLFKIDMENQIIKLEDVDLKKNDIKDEENFDEFDNSKNGRHKKSINELENNLMLRSQTLETEPEKGSKLFQYLTLNGKERKLPYSSSQVIDRSKKKKQKKKALGDEKQERRLLKREKEVNDIENVTVKLDTGLERDSNIEECSVEADVFNIKEVEECESSQNEASQVNLGDYNKKHMIKVVKPKSLGMKRGKRKKLAGVKEKPSSYTCNYCQKVYPSEGGWRYHIHTMHNENYQPFICDLCGQTFKVKKNLESHKNSIHFHLKLHLCDLCGRGFASKYGLKVHKIWHNDEKNFTCDICGTKFRTLGKLNTHKSVHGGPKKFMCHICSRDFRWKKDFDIHVRTHTGEKPFKCSHCGKAFVSLTNMKKHERNHLDKLVIAKNSDAFDVISSTNDERLFRTEILDFPCGPEAPRNKPINQI